MALPKKKLPRTVANLNIKSLGEIPEAVWVPLNDVGFDLNSGGGLPEQVIVELYGPKQAGKTTISFEAIKSFLKKHPDKLAKYYNYERSIDRFYVQNLLDHDEDLINRFLIIEPVFLEDGMNALIEDLKSDDTCISVVDSVAAMIPSTEFEKELGESRQQGMKAKLMAEVCRKLEVNIKNSSQTVIFINHVNVQLDIGMPHLAGKVKETPGGDSLKYAASIRINVDIMSRLEKAEIVPGAGKKNIPYGQQLMITFHKNKFFPPYKRCVMYIYFGKGISRELSLIDYGLEQGIIGLDGKTMYYINTDKRKDQKFHGKENFAIFLRENPKLTEKLFKIVFDHFSPTSAPEEEPVAIQSTPWQQQETETSYEEQTSTDLPELIEDSSDESNAETVDV